MIHFNGTNSMHRPSLYGGGKRWPRPWPLTTGGMEAKAQTSKKKQKKTEQTDSRSLQKKRFQGCTEMGFQVTCPSSVAALILTLFSLAR